MFGRKSRSSSQQEQQGSRHAQDVQATREDLGTWPVEAAVVEAMKTVDLYAIRAVLEKHRVTEPHWDEQRDARYLNDSRVAHLAAGGYVFENLSVYMTMTQLLHPALAGPNAVVLDVGCGTGAWTCLHLYLFSQPAQPGICG
jgi:protein-L-isoaspartate O-methyltransferase